MIVAEFQSSRITRSGRGAFTLIELLATIAILAILAGMAGVYIAGYVQTSKKIADQRTLLTLNDALNRWKCEGGTVTALTTYTPISRVVGYLQSPVQWGGLTHNVMNTSKTYHGSSIAATGTGAQYHFTRYNTYSADNTGVTPGQLTGQGSGLVGWWKLDQANGGNDLSGNGNTASASGTSFGTVADHKGKANGATSFDGSTSNVAFNSYINFSDTSPWTFSLWMYWTKTSADNRFVGSGGSNCYIGLYEAGYYPDFTFRAGAPTYTLYDIPNNSSNGCGNTWKHITFVADGKGTLWFYKDGSLFQTLTGVSTSFNFKQLGVGYTGYGVYGGYISDVRIYNRALSASEVSQLYAQ